MLMCDNTPGSPNFGCWNTDLPSTDFTDVMRQFVDDHHNGIFVSVLIFVAVLWIIAKLCDGPDKYWNTPEGQVELTHQQQNMNWANAELFQKNLQNYEIDPVAENQLNPINLSKEHHQRQRLSTLARDMKWFGFGLGMILAHSLRPRK